MTFSPSNPLERFAVFLLFFCIELVLFLGPKVLVSFLGFFFLGLRKHFSFRKIFYLVLTIAVFQLLAGRIFFGETYFSPLSSIFPIPLQITDGSSWSAIIGGSFTLDILFSVFHELKTYSGLYITIPRNVYFFILIILNNLVPAIFLYFATKRYLKLEGKIRILTWLILALAVSMIHINLN